MNYIDRLQRFCLGKYELLMMKKGLSIENDGTKVVHFSGFEKQKSLQGII